MSTAMSNVDRVKFMDGRLRLIDAGEAFDEMPLDGNPRVVLHMFPTQPLEGVNLAASLGFSATDGVTDDIITPSVLQPIITGSFTRVRGDEDGLLIYTGYSCEVVGRRGILTS